MMAPASTVFPVVALLLSTSCFLDLLGIGRPPCWDRTIERQGLGGPARTKRPWGLTPRTGRSPDARAGRRARAPGRGARSPVAEGLKPAGGTLGLGVEAQGRSIGASSVERIQQSS